MQNIIIANAYANIAYADHIINGQTITVSNIIDIVKKYKEDEDSAVNVTLVKLDILRNVKIGGKLYTRCTNIFIKNKRHLKTDVTDIVVLTKQLIKNNISVVLSDGKNISVSLYESIYAMLSKTSIIDVEYPHSQEDIGTLCSFVRNYNKSTSRCNVYVHDALSYNVFNGEPITIALYDVNSLNLKTYLIEDKHIRIDDENNVDWGKGHLVCTNPINIVNKGDKYFTQKEVWKGARLDVQIYHENSLIKTKKHRKVCNEIMEGQKMTLKYFEKEFTVDGKTVKWSDLYWTDLRAVEALEALIGSSLNECSLNTLIEYLRNIQSIIRYNNSKCLYRKANIDRLALACILFDIKDYLLVFDDSINGSIKIYEDSERANGLYVQHVDSDRVLTGPQKYGLSIYPYNVPKAGTLIDEYQRVLIKNKRRNVFYSPSEMTDEEIYKKYFKRSAKKK